MAANTQDCCVLCFQEITAGVSRGTCQTCNVLHHRSCARFGYTCPNPLCDSNPNASSLGQFLQEVLCAYERRRGDSVLGMISQGISQTRLSLSQFFNPNAVAQAVSVTLRGRDPDNNCCDVLSPLVADYEFRGVALAHIVDLLIRCEQVTRDPGAEPYKKIALYLRDPLWVKRLVQDLILQYHPDNLQVKIPYPNLTAIEQRPEMSRLELAQVLQRLCAVEQYLRKGGLLPAAQWPAADPDQDTILDPLRDRDRLLNNLIASLENPLSLDAFKRTNLGAQLEGVLGVPQALEAFNNAAQTRHVEAQIVAPTSVSRRIARFAVPPVLIVILMTFLAAAKVFHHTDTGGVGPNPPTPIPPGPTPPAVTALVTCFSLLAASVGMPAAIVIMIFIAIFLVIFYCHCTGAHREAYGYFRGGRDGYEAV